MSGGSWVPDACVSGYYLSVSGSSAPSCVGCPSMPNCAFCVSATQCGSCNVGYYWNTTTNMCMGCPTPNCFFCNGPSGCAACNTGYAGSGTGVCYAADPNCIIAVANNNCTVCATGYNTNAQGTCTKQTCTTWCQECTGPGANQCIVCMSGYYMSNNTCMACPANCQACRLTSSTTMPFCEECAFGYAMTDAMNPQMCKACTMGANCFACLNYAFVNSNGMYNGGCEECMPGYLNNQGMCQMAPGGAAGLAPGFAVGAFLVAVWAVLKTV